MSNIKEELKFFRDQIEEAKSELFILRMTPLDNRSKSYLSDKRKYKKSICRIKKKIEPYVKNGRKKSVKMKKKNEENTL